MKHTRTSQVRGAVLIAAVAFLPTLAGAATLRILTPADSFLPGSYALESPGYSSMRSKLASAFTTIESVSLGSPNAASGADAYWINLLNYESSYTSAELATIAGLGSSASPAVILFENDFWTMANIQLGTAVGGTYLGDAADAALAPGNQPLLQNVSSLYFSITGLMGGGVQIAGDAISLFGAHRNLLLIGDVNMLADNNIHNSDNSRFGNNVATFLAGQGVTTPVPEPGAPAILGLLGVCALWFRRRAN
jgi:MYXO-CTERM domain-containing protein